MSKLQISVQAEMARSETTVHRIDEDPTAGEWLRRLAAGETTAVALVERTLDALQAADAGLGAVVASDPERALGEAAEADAVRRRGEQRPLLGLPITVKDNLDVAGLRTAAGSAARPDHVAASDASAVRRLRDAGAIVVAKTNVPEASCDYETENAVFGRTAHPLDPARTPGGSSGGEAALLAAGATIVGVGTDGGGSIRVPSHYCGIPGLRPTVGRVPETGQWPPTRASGMGDLSCIGPMARHVEDLGLLLAVMAGPDGIDPYAVPVPLGSPADVDLATLRVAWYDEDPAVPVTEGTRAAVAAAAVALADVGCLVEKVAAPPATEATELFFAAVGGDGGAHLLEHCGHGGPHTAQFRALLASFPDTPPPASHVFALQRRVLELRARVRAWASAHDIVLCPVVAGPAPRHGERPGPAGAGDAHPYAAFNYVHTYALAGMPAASVPVGTENGLPLGVQVVGAPWREDVVLAAARAIESMSRPQGDRVDR
jgi:Asp-tRNA(Asn)/Glu-tRNA(Gln) amidotransferase A subunit family amidase